MPVYEVHTYEVHAHNTHEVYAYEMHANEVYLYAMHARKMHAHKMRAHQEMLSAKAARQDHSAGGPHASLIVDFAYSSAPSRCQPISLLGQPSNTRGVSRCR
jgi:hypothetical protein